MTKREKGILLAAAILVLALAIVLVWQSTKLGGAQRTLEEARAELALQRHESTLALAAIEASRGSYELGRQLASSFFTGLQADLPGAPDDAQPALSQVLAERDAMITALSRSDPQVAPQLVQLLIRYRMALGEPVGPQPQGTLSAPVSPAQPADTIS